MKTFFAEEQKRHDPTFFLSSGAPQPNPEQPERAERLLAGARAAGMEILRPKDHGLGPVAAVHTPEYLDFLRRIYTRWQRIEGASRAGEDGAAVPPTERVTAPAHLVLRGSTRI